MDREELRQEMKRQMTGLMKEIVGSGYVEDYYEQLAQDFIGCAEWYANAATAEIK